MRTLVLIASSISMICSVPSEGENMRFPVLTQDTLKTDTIAIEEILISRKMDPRSIFEAKKAYHKEIYLLGDNKDMFTFSPFGGIAVNIQKLYNHFSHRGRAARKLQRRFELEYEQDLATEIWEPLLLEYTTLRGDSLTKFKLYCNPSLDFLHEASHYDHIAYLLQNVKNYKDSADIIHNRLRLIPEDKTE
ncbi:hypothetical protein [Sphingobacterium deserti]|uniref:Uncharacterized protein n=1 Tax=Sphingobacterium deserti TaxID=1229276 RepID=A0A0B8T982_9SPHI|nr:hypothetical protein [Sphingobacterium deserti]KGE15254.1 hypothetical protein DI53_0935 [Sphingobacterium deserti]